MEKYLHSWGIVVDLLQFDLNTQNANKLFCSGTFDLKEVSSTVSTTASCSYLTINIQGYPQRIGL